MTCHLRFATPGDLFLR